MKILIATNNQGDGDWKGLYIDGKLIEEGHSLRLWDVLTQIKDRKEPIDALSELSLRNDQMESLGNSFPASELELWEHERATSAA